MCATYTPEQVDEYEQEELSSISDRLSANPQPALRWATVMTALVGVQFGAFIGGVLTLIDAAVIAITALVEIAVGLISSPLASAVVDLQRIVSGAIGELRDTAGSLPTLLSRETIPNQGYLQSADGPWTGTFMGVEPAIAWALRAILIVGYSFGVLYWLFYGWQVFRTHYRRASWTPTDDVIARLRGHRWGQFGIFVLILFLTMAVFGPALGPTTVEQNIQSPYSAQMQYFDAEDGTVKTIAPGDANFESKSKGSADQNVGVMQYDAYNRFHPFGTLTNGRDLFTFMMGGARITLIVAGLAIGLGTLIAASLALISAYYRGRIDLGILTTADGVISIPKLLLLIMISAVFADHWIAQALDGGLLLALIFAFTGWPFLWRAIRGPAFQVAQEAWVDAAKSFGQPPRTIMRRHMLPYLTGYLLVYASLSTGGIIIGLAALSFLGNGLGITPPTPAWGRAVSLGQSYVASRSWHISLIPGLMIVILVTGLNAFGDGLRDAIDPESEGTQNQEQNATATTGGGG